MKTQDLGEVDGVLLLFSISNALLVSLKLIHHFESWAVKGPQDCPEHKLHSCAGGQPGDPHPLQWWQEDLDCQLEEPRSSDLGCLNTKIPKIVHLSQMICFLAK